MKGLNRSKGDLSVLTLPVSNKYTNDLEESLLWEVALLERLKELTNWRAPRYSLRSVSIQNRSILSFSPLESDSPSPSLVSIL